MQRGFSAKTPNKTALRGQRLTGGRFPSEGRCASGAAVGGDCEAIASGLKEKVVSHAKLIT